MYFEADCDRSASLRLFISCQQTRKQRLNVIRAKEGMLCTNIHLDRSTTLQQFAATHL